MAAKVAKKVGVRPGYNVRYRTDSLALSDQGGILNPDSLNERRSPPEQLFDRIQHWSAGAEIHAGGPFFGVAGRLEISVSAVEQGDR
jgi:hypothetical protein